VGAAPTRFEWPDARISARHGHSTHGIGLAGTLQLAHRLGRLPDCVEVFGIEIGTSPTHGGMCPEVTQSVTTLAQTISAGLNELFDARTVVGKSVDPAG
jgi:hypothetical protein